jgi:hypothetical protein
MELSIVYQNDIHLHFELLILLLRICSETIHICKKLHAQGFLSDFSQRKDFEQTQILVSKALVKRWSMYLIKHQPLKKEGGDICSCSWVHSIYKDSPIAHYFYWFVLSGVKCNSLKVFRIPVAKRTVLVASRTLEGGCHLSCKPYEYCV